MKEEVSLFLSFTRGVCDVHSRSALVFTQDSLTPFSVQPPTSTTAQHNCLPPAAAPNPSPASLRLLGKKNRVRRKHGPTPVWVGEKKLEELVRMRSAPIAAGAEVGTAVAALAAPEVWYAQQVLRQAGCCAGPCRQLPSAPLKRWGCIM